MPTYIPATPSWCHIEVGRWKKGVGGGGVRTGPVEGQVAMASLQSPVI